MRYGVRQTELAEMMGYEQTYISALEVDKKGPPNQEFINRLIKALNLTPEEREQLLVAADASQRKFKIDSEVHQDVYWMIRDLRNRLPEITTVQVQLIRQILGLNESLIQRPIEVRHQLKKRRNQEAKM
jgi:transcriptional regulator with XRE-family HTH domain